MLLLVAAVMGIASAMQVLVSHGGDAMDFIHAMSAIIDVVAKGLSGGVRSYSGDRCEVMP